MNETARRVIPVAVTEQQEALLAAEAAARGMTVEELVADILSEELDELAEELFDDDDDASRAGSVL